MKARDHSMSEGATQDLGWQQVPSIAPIPLIPFSFVSFAVLPTLPRHWKSPERAS